ncbi:carbohydrate kinase [Coccidioides immitis H538.4]|uniref:Carbohydrate kinase n=1 Tax=Coccidioides immitis H538.4 TaxID=396776 RepID=A0A0J8RES4_COCIT|nr:carbohydrate kinase [Coccidioides immitis H538.4]
MSFIWTAARSGTRVDLRVRGTFLRNHHHVRTLSRSANKFLKISEEVQDAVATGKPVVALETTIYTHGESNRQGTIELHESEDVKQSDLGFPYPENVDLAKRLESIVRENGGVPATIGILNGVARVGMSTAELTELTSACREKNVLKVSRRDLGYICGIGLAGKHMHGGTTIAGTMVLAHLAGIKVLLQEDLVRSYLDVSLSETQGVVVATFADGRKGPIDFPAFFTRDSGIQSPRTLRDAAEAAAIIVPEKHSFLKAEMDAIIAKAVELSHIEGIHGSDNTPYVLAKIKELSGGRSVETNRALVECNVEIGTKVAIELGKLESGSKDDGNRYMPVVNGTRQRAKTSESESQGTNPATENVSAKPAPKAIEKVDILIAGSLAVDLACDFAPSTGGSNAVSPALYTSNPSVISQSLGGVGYNVALASSYLGSSVLFCSVVANDISGRSALAALQKVDKNLHFEGVQTLETAAGARTAQYIAVNDAKKELVLAMADMSILELPSERLEFDEFWEPMIHRTNPTWAVIDANWSPEAMSRWVSLCKAHGIKIAFEPVSALKATRLFSKTKSGNIGNKPIFDPLHTAPTNHLIDIITPNCIELASIHTTAREAGLFHSPEWWKIINSFSLPSAGSRDRFTSLTSAAIVDKGIPQQSIQLLPFIPCIVTKLGKQGALLTQLLPSRDSRLTNPEYAPYILGRAAGSGDGDSETGIGGVYMRLFPAAEKLEEGDVVSVNGAGDTLLGLLVSALAVGENSGRAEKTRVENVIPLAQQASIKTLKSKGGVSPDIKSLRPLLEKL